VDTRHVEKNDPCPCGSGKKYRQCCWLKRLDKPSVAVPRSVHGVGAALSDRVVAKSLPKTGGHVPKAVTRVPVDYVFSEPFGQAVVGYSFEIGRLVSLPGGYVTTVERLKPGDQFILDNGLTATVTAVGQPKVWEPPPATPDENGNYHRRVIGHIKRTGFMVLDLTFGGLTVSTTSGHPFYSLDRKCWVVAERLDVGERLLNDRGQQLRLEAKGPVRQGIVELYNIEVEQHHTYFVGRDRGSSVLVHNGVGGGGPGGCIPLPGNPQGGKPIARTGTARPGVTVTEAPLADLNPLHSVPRPGKPPNHVQDLANKIQTNGYDLAQPIPVARMPDGRLVIMGGHHRVEAMKQLGETTIPARVVDWNTISPGAQKIYRDSFPTFPWDDFIK
jgi:hypothetical protein